ncbi:unnamed protein product [Schistocephalus solidus]|uniref:RING-type domain-containing protein n=1 Tax=Schistocephalus solidus TaxID=70667 RepID=A0A183S748_SCHSO|nr:unnamed protein product [Schistocephalus solidus]
MDPADRMTTEVLLKHKYLEAIQARHCASNVLLPPGMSILPSPAGDTMPQPSLLQPGHHTSNSRQPVGFAGAAVLPATEKCRAGGGGGTGAPTVGVTPQPTRRKVMKNVYLPPYQLVGWPRSESTSGLGVIGGSCMPNSSLAGGSQTTGLQSLGCGVNPAGWRSGPSKPAMTFAGQTPHLRVDEAVIRSNIGIADHQHVLSISPSDENIVQQLPAPSVESFGVYAGAECHRHSMQPKTPVCDGCKKADEDGNDLPCKHFLCKSCVDTALKDSAPKCTACKKEFKKNQLEPHCSICMDITCEGGDTCGKMHLVDVVPKTT